MNSYQKWINCQDLKPELKNELLEMNEEEKYDAFYTDLSFGTGGMRGIIGAGTNRMNIYTLRKANWGYGNFIKKRHPEGAIAVIAFDSRHKSKEFALESAMVLASMGIRCYLFEKITPTPVLSFSIRYLNAQGGIVITASHNPPKYNGYKIYDDTGCQLVPDLADQVIGEIKNAPDIFHIPVKSYELLVSEGMIATINGEVYDEYIKQVKALSVRPNLDKSQFKIVFTPLHGTAGIFGERLLKELGYQYYLVNEQMVPDPDFSTVAYPNPEDPNAFHLAIQYAKRYEADICIATDPDADRVGLAVYHNQSYTLLTGNQTGAILIYYLVNNRKTEIPGVVFNTIVTSDLGAAIARKHGLEVKSTLTGFKYIGEQIRLLEGTNKKFFFGYEESYGYVIGDFVRDKDSLQALLICAEAANYYKQKGKTLLDVLEDIYTEYGYYYDDLVSITLEGESGAKKIKATIDSFRYSDIKTLGNQKIIRKEDYLLQEKTENGQISRLEYPKSNVLKYVFEKGGWFVIRPSGTEPKMKFYISVIGKSKAEAENEGKTLKELIFKIIEKAG